MSISSFFVHGFKHFYLTQIILCTINHLYIISFSHELQLICLAISIAIVSTQLNGFNYCDLTLIILFNINHLFAHNEVVTSIAI